MQDNHLELLKVSNLKVHFRLPSEQFFSNKPRIVKAVDDVSFSLKAGETLGVVGESGCGKSTLGRAILQLIKPTQGKILWQNNELTTASDKSLQAYRKDLQIIFQDPLASLDPRMTIGEIIAEPLAIHEPHLSKKERLEKVNEIMQKVGLLPEMINRYPHEFSGGQCQRIGIARAMILRPKLIICDEPVSALDVSIQAQVITLLMDLQKEFGLSLIFISHDLSVVRHLCHRILVLYLGNLVELAVAEDLYDKPLHPYTKALISAVPIPDPAMEKNKQRIVLKGDLPSPLNPPSGCVFRTRCPNAMAICETQKPALQIQEEREVACHLYSSDKIV